MGGFGIIFFAVTYSIYLKGLIDFKTMALLDAFLFASPHLFSSYLRVYSDKAEVERYKVVSFVIPIIIILITYSIIHFSEMSLLWTLGSVYFYWQWWHHARQSFGIGRKYQFSLNEKLSDLDLKLNDITLWSIAILGICLKSNIVGDHYEGIPLKVIHLPIPLVSFVVVVTSLIGVIFVGRQLFIAFSKNIIQTSFLAHLGVHSLVFIMFFGLLPTDIGILAASMWHCTQYMSYVKGHQQIKAERNLLSNRFLSYLFKEENIYIYFAVLFLFSLSIPLSRFSLQELQLNTLALSFSMALTFHHYILDGVVWTKREITWSLSPKNEAINSTQGTR
jgi:hypothetical protein